MFKKSRLRCLGADLVGSEEEEAPLKRGKARREMCLWGKVQTKVTCRTGSWAALACESS